MATTRSAESRRRRYAWAIALGAHLVLLILLAFVGFSSRPTAQPHPIAIAFPQPKAIEKPVEKVEKPMEKKKGEKTKTPKAIEAVKTHRPSKEGIKTVEQLLEETPPVKASPIKEPKATASDAKNDNTTAGTQPGRTAKKAFGKGNAKPVHPSAYSGKSTVSYLLPNRTAIRIANPVYTCIRGGVVVIDIRVNRGGAVTHAAIDKSRSHTTDRCLWDAALAYAKRSRFNANPKARRSQPGYITYQFQPNGSADRTSSLSTPLEKSR